MRKKNRSQKIDDWFYIKQPSFKIAELRRNTNLEDINRVCLFCDQKAKEAYNFEKKRYPHKFIKILNDLMYAYFCSVDPAYLRYPDSATWEQLWKGFKMTLDTRYNLKHDRRRLAYVLEGNEYVQVDLCREGESYRLLSTTPDKVKKGTCSIDEQTDSDLSEERSPLDEIISQEEKGQLEQEISKLPSDKKFIIRTLINSDFQTSQEELANQLGCSQPRISQLKKEAMETLQEHTGLKFSIK